MSKIKYYTCGSMQEKEGMTIGYNVYEEEGDTIFVGKPHKQIYKRKEITEEEYLRYKEMIASADIVGLAGGLLDEKGKKALKEWYDSIEKSKVEIHEPRIALTVKKIKKQLDLGIIDEADIDTEIELNRMTQFAEIIKERIAQ